ncbi:MAG: type II secretion system protein GspE [Candidatus Omnitrophica bacterium]|nr:type II secretion system protein GspE [Candidatus Omnitrophota bacterium]
MKLDVTKEKLVQELVQDHKLEEARVKKIMDTGRRERKSIFQLLVEENLISEPEIFDFLSERLSMPLLNLPAMRVSKDLIQLVPKRIIERHQILPVSRIGNLLSVAASDPFNLMFQDDLKKLTQCHVVVVLAPPRMIGSAIEAYYGGASNLEQILENLDDEKLEIIRGEETEDEGKTKQATEREAEDAPVVRMVDVILAQGIKSRASDIHFEPYEKEFRIRYRIDGTLKEAFRQSRDIYNLIVARVKIMATLDITEKRLPQDGRFRVSIGGKDIDMRVSILPIYHGEKIVLRILDKSSMKTGLNQIGYTEKQTAAFATAIRKPYGMILVTGPTGSGKSTTLYTVLNTLNTIERNIMTVEDPVEYQVHGITQTQVRPDVGLTFASGLRSLLRQSPDVILVGEIRDTETGDIAVKAALTGHLVFSTLHTNSAAGAFTRLMDMKVEPFLIASSVVCVSAQRLMRRICQYCKTAMPVPEEVLRRCHLKLSDLDGAEIFKGKGCAKCNQTGYFGRIPASEVLLVDNEIRDLVIGRKSSDAIEKVAVEKGMETLFLNALGIFKRGITTLEEVLRVTSNE